MGHDDSWPTHLNFRSFRQKNQSTVLDFYRFLVCFCAVAGVLVPLAFHGNIEGSFYSLVSRPSRNTSNRTAYQCEPGGDLSLNL